MQHIVLVIGSGGREHVICWKLSQSPHVKKILVAPGNAGIKLVDKVELIELNIKNTKEVAKWSKDNNIDLVVIGPEDPLSQGLADDLKDVGIKCFGPEKQAAQIEANKDWAKQFMDRHDIPTARWQGFTSAVDAQKFVKTAPFKALVVKASGLAAGKGVVVAKDQQEACQAIDEILTNKKFGAAGDTVVVEELLEGEEVSVLAFTDGKTVVPMMPAQDHKRIFNDDTGPNTGGMGAYCPCPLLSEEDYEYVKVNVLQKTVDGLRKENIPFVGVLYAGLMLTEDGPKILEFNCRFGDPETEVVLPLLTSDLFTIMKACCEGTLDASHVSWRKDVFAVGVILASRGYPTISSKGQVITGTCEVSRRQDHFVFHCGTALKKVGVLISGSGTNLQSLIDATQDPSQHIGAEIVLVISNKSGVEGLKRAERANIKTVVIKHTDYPNRETFDSAMNIELHAAGVEIVCLAGFMRILSEKFVKHWKGALLNIHPSLLPAFKGANAHKDVLAARVRVSGCTVHFVEVDIDSGAIIEQQAVPVLPFDTEKILQERVKIAEHQAYPRALKHLATGRIKLKEDGTLHWNF